MTLTPEQMAELQNEFDRKSEKPEIDELTLLDDASRAALRNRIEAETKRARDHLRRLEWRADPKRWVDERLDEFMWSVQVQIAESVRDNRKTAVPSCFASGKSWLAARLAAWWIDTHPPGEAFVVTTATTAAQVKAILWREIGRAHSKGNLDGRLNQTEWRIMMPHGKEEQVAFGRKPADMDKAAFQGIHERWVLVILDEAAGIPASLWDAAESLTANEESRILAIGNPEDAGSEFAKVCDDTSDWHVIKIPAFATPNFTGEEVPERLRKVLISKIYVDEKLKKWGETSPMWKAKILAEFPEVREDGLIPIAWIRAAQDRQLEPVGPRELGVDVGGGGDKSIIGLRTGPVFRIVKRSDEPDTMKTLADVEHVYDEENAELAKVDEIGIGRGIVDAARRSPRKILGVNVGRAAKDKRGYANLRAEACWKVRELFQNGLIDIDPHDEDLVAQLLEIRYKRVGGRIQIESKREMKQRGIPSPDEFDCLVLAFVDRALAGRPPKRRRLGWG